ncbi:MAG: DegV family protein [Lachnospiraceae bacterium]|nr:DegV family protein [Lachnospiraceae bacterium]
MSEYIIFTDSGCDIVPETLDKWGVKRVSLSFKFNDDEREYLDGDMPIKDFYQKMRDGGVAKTSAVNTETFKMAFEQELKAGRDILYIGFSSGLSSTSEAGQVAAAELQQEYPERKLIAIDTLAASAGEGLLVWMAVQKKAEGASMDEVAQWVKDNCAGMCQWFTVDDLVYLKRGGRVSATVALAGAVLGIKPVMHVDDEGHLINMTKVRGRKQSIKALAQKYTELAKDPKGGTFFISHGDCLEDAQLLSDMICQEHGVSAGLITNVGAVIGAHSGPGTLALFFPGKER